jgi:cytidine deaminase
MLDLSDDFKLAQNARQYSKPGPTNFAVGAVLKCKNGKRYVGCNIHNDGIQSICAERTAFVKAVSEGDTEFERIAIASSGGEAWPCGICRQFMKEFCDDDFVVITGNDADSIRTYTLAELLPEGFRL